MDEIPKYKIHIDFDKLDGQTLFPEKVELANNMLKKIKLPDFTKYRNEQNQI